MPDSEPRFSRRKFLTTAAGVAIGAAVGYDQLKPNNSSSQPDPNEGLTISPSEISYSESKLLKYPTPEYIADKYYPGSYKLVLKPSPNSNGRSVVFRTNPEVVTFSGYEPTPRPGEKAPDKDNVISRDRIVSLSDVPIEESDNEVRVSKPRIVKAKAAGTDGRFPFWLQIRAEVKQADGSIKKTWLYVSESDESSKVVVPSDKNLPYQKYDPASFAIPQSEIGKVTKLPPKTS